MNTGGLDFRALKRDFGDVEAETRACREAAALFDFSFLAVADVSGAGAADAIARLTARELSGMRAGEIRYALRTSENGNLVSDLTVWRHGADRYQVMSGRHQDILELVDAAGGATHCEDRSGELSVLAIQGPGSLRALEPLADTARLAAVPYFRHAPAIVHGVDCGVGRLGYTGERGFEIVAPAKDRDALWSALGEVARPAGFAAADALRIEAGFVLFTNEFALNVTAAEAGLARFAGPSDPAPRARLVCFCAEDGPSPRPFCPRQGLAPPGARGGISVTSAADSPAAGGILGLGFVHPDDAAEGAVLEDVEGEFRGVRAAALPFYDPGKRKPRGAW